MVRAEARGGSAHQWMVLVLGGGSVAGARLVLEDERPALPGLCARDHRLHGKFGGANSRRRLRAASTGARSVDRRLLLHRACTRAARPSLRRRGDDRARGGSDDRSSRSSDRSDTADFSGTLPTSIKKSHSPCLWARGNSWFSIAAPQVIAEIEAADETQSARGEGREDSRRAGASTQPDRVAAGRVWPVAYRDRSRRFVPRSIVGCRIRTRARPCVFGRGLRVSTRLARATLTRARSLRFVRR